MRYIKIADDKAYEITMPSGHIYDIEYERLKETSQLVAWILQLSPKTWVTKEHIEELIYAFSKQTGIEFYV